MRPNKNLSLRAGCAIALATAVFLLNLSVSFGQSADEALEREAQAIDRMIMCPVCPAETIDQAQVEISFQMRAVIREMLAEGRTREDILDYFVDRYGPDILAAPPKSGANLLAWVLPIVGVAAGLVGVFLVIRSMTGKQRPTPAAPASVSGSTETAEGPLTDPEMAPYLEIADRLLASRGTATANATVGTGPMASGQACESQDATEELGKGASGESRSHG